MSRRRRRGYGEPINGFTGGTEMVVKIGNIKGDALVANHEDWIPILAWSWGASKAIGDAKKPKHILEKIKKKKEAILKAKGINTEEDENKEPENLENLSYREKRRRMRELEKAELDRAEALSDYDSDNPEDNQFLDSEVKPRRTGKPNIQDISLTKYVDISSPEIYTYLLGQKQGIDITLRICKEREIKEEKPSTDGKEEANNNNATAAGDKAKSKSSDDFDDPDADSKEKKDEKEPNMETCVLQEFVFQDCYITSFSTGGSGGEDRLTENITINFSGFQYRYVDYLGNSPSAATKPANKSLIYDPLRSTVRPFDEAVRNELKKNDQLGQVQSVVMGYL